MLKIITSQKAEGQFTSLELASDIQSCSRLRAYAAGPELGIDVAQEDTTGIGVNVNQVKIPKGYTLGIYGFVR
jgi:hypothetical protein